MIRKILSFGAAEGFSRGISWLLVIILAAILPVSEYGYLSLILAIEGLVIPLMLLGQDRSVLRYYADKELRETGILNQITLIWFAFSLILVLIFIVLVYIYEIDKFLGITIAPFGYMFLFSLICLGYIKLYLSILRVESNSRQYAFVRLGHQIIRAVILITVFLLYKDINNYPLISLIAAIVVIIPIAKSYILRSACVQTRHNYKRLLLFGAPLILHALSGNILAYIDRFMLEYYLDIESVGVYTLAYMLGSGITFLYGLIAIYFEPYIYRKRQEDVDAIEYPLAVYSRILFVLVSIFGVIIIGASEFLLTVIFGQEYALATRIIPIVLFAHILNIIYLQASYRLTAFEKTGTIAFGTMIASVINITANILLIPEHGAMGAAYATFFSYAFYSIFLYLLSYYKTEKSKYIKKYIWNYLFLILIMLSALLIDATIIYISSLLLLMATYTVYIFKYDHRALKEIISKL